MSPGYWVERKYFVTFMLRTYNYCCTTLVFMCVRVVSSLVLVFLLRQSSTTELLGPDTLQLCRVTTTALWRRVNVRTADTTCYLLTLRTATQPGEHAKSTQTVFLEPDRGILKPSKSWKSASFLDSDRNPKPPDLFFFLALPQSGNMAQFPHFYVFPWLSSCGVYSHAEPERCTKEEGK